MTLGEDDSLDLDIHIEVDEIKELISKLKINEVYKKQCLIILEGEINVISMLKLIKYVLTSVTVIVSDANALEITNVELKELVKQIKEDYLALENTVKEVSNKLDTIKHKYQELKEDYATLQVSTREIWVPFPRCREELVDLNKKYIDVDIQMEFRIEAEYDNLRKEIISKYNIHDIESGTTVPLVDLLFACPSRTGEFGIGRLAHMINARISDQESNESNVRRRTQEKVLSKLFTLDQSNRWLGDEDVSIYIKRESRTFDKRAYLERSVFDIENNSSKTFRLHLKTQYPDDPKVTAMVKRDHRAHDAFFDGFTIDRSAMQEGAYLMEVITLTPLELDDLMKNTPKEITNRRVFGDVSSINNCQFTLDDPDRVRYDVLVVTKLDIANMTPGLTYGVRSWRLDTIEIFEGVQEEITVPQLCRATELLHPKGKPGFILYEHSPSGEVTEHHSVPSGVITANTVRIQDTVWRRVTTGGTCVQHERPATVISADDTRWFNHLARYGLSLDSELPKGHDRTESLRSEVIDLKEALRIANQEISNSKMVLKNKLDGKDRMIAKVKQDAMIKVQEVKDKLAMKEITLHDANSEIRRLKFLLMDTKSKAKDDSEKLSRKLSGKQDKRRLIHGGLVALIPLLLGTLVLRDKKLITTVVMGFIGLSTKTGLAMISK